MAPSSVPSGVVSSDAGPAVKAKPAAVANRKKVATPAVESKIASMPISQGNKKDDSDSGGGYTTI